MLRYVLASNKNGQTKIVLQQTATQNGSRRLTKHDHSKNGQKIGNGGFVARRVLQNIFLRVALVPKCKARIYSPMSVADGEHGNVLCLPSIKPLGIQPPR